MGTISITKTIDAPKGAVFEAFTDLTKVADRIPDIVKIEVLADALEEVGTKWLETRKMFGKEATEELEVTGFEPGRLFVAACDGCGSHFKASYGFSEQGGSTRVDFTMETTPGGFFARLMGGLMTGTMKKCCEKDMDTLKGWIESRSTAAAGA